MGSIDRVFDLIDKAKGLQRSLNKMSIEYSNLENENANLASNLKDLEAENEVFESSILTYEEERNEMTTEIATQAELIANNHMMVCDEVAEVGDVLPLSTRTELEETIVMLQSKLEQADNMLAAHAHKIATLNQDIVAFRTKAIKYWGTKDHTCNNCKYRHEEADSFNCDPCQDFSEWKAKV